MKKPASPAWGIVSWVIYIAIILGIGFFTDVDYDKLGESTTSLFQAVVLPVAIASIAMALMATWLGWWKPALRDRQAAKHKWPIIATVCVVAIAAINTINAPFGDLGAQWILYAAAGTLLVGFGEEMANRGLLLVGFRGRLGEGWVWLLTSVMFGIMHAGNALNGQSIGDTMQQVGFTMVAGTIYYITRRVTGTLIWAMLVHAFWDFGSIAFAQSSADAPAIVFILNLLSYLAALVGVYFVIKGAKEKLGASEGSAEEAPATA